MRWLIEADPSGGGTLRPLDDAGHPTGADRPTTDLPAALAAAEPDRPRWVWPDTTAVYPALLAAGVRLSRCHDLALTEALLSGHDGRWGEPRALPAAWARLRGLPVPADPPPHGAHPESVQPTLFEPDRPDPLPGAATERDAAAAVHADQLRRIAGLDRPAAFRLLVAAESAAALAAVEMGATGLPWRADVHDRLLTDALGERPIPGARPPVLAGLAEQITAAFGGPRVNPDSPAEVIRAFTRAGVTLTSTRAHALRAIDHPAVPLLLRYKELARLHSANGWAFLSAWVRDGRFHPEYVAGGVVSGRWATRGGGALQIPKAVRRAVIADPGWTLVVADASQLEPRILAALSGDDRLAAAAGTGDLYAALADSTFAGDRGKAKIALLAAMYGGTSGDGGVLLGTLRRRFPVAVGYVEDAARDGEAGRLVRSHLGRTCPPPSAGWFGPTDTPAGEPTEDPDVASTHGRTAAAARSRGRFTRNFVVQATASDWALILLAELRGTLAALPPAELVFFQHDEVIVHCPADLAAEVSEAITTAAATAADLLFGATPVRFPLQVAAVDCYADAK